MAIVVARTSTSGGGTVYWDGEFVWWPDINRGLRFTTEAEAKEAVAEHKMLREKRGLNPVDTVGYDYINMDDLVVLSGGPSGNVFVKNYIEDKDTTPNGYTNPATDA